MKISFLGNFSVHYCSEAHHAKTLEKLGHEVIRLQEPQATNELILATALNSDLFIWIHTHGWNTPNMKKVLDECKEAGVPTLTYHLDLWFGLQRQKDIQSDEYWNIEHFFTVDKQMAQWLNNNTKVKGHYIPAGVLEEECYMAEKQSDIPVAFVGSKGYHPEWKYRPYLLQWLKQNYGRSFQHWGGDGLGVKRGVELNQLYADTKIVIGDTLCVGYNYPYYYSDRVFETIGRGGFIIHPYIKGLEEIFEDKKHLVFYEFRNMKQLRDLINYYLEHEEERELIRKQGHEYVKLNHSYTNRWESILKSI